MNRAALLQELEREAAMPGPLPGVPFDHPADQAARREALKAELRETDQYKPSRGRRLEAAA